MAGIFGYLTGLDRETFLDGIEKSVFWNGVQMYTQAHMEELNRIYSVFIEQEVTIYSERYRLPGGGRLQDSDRQTLPAAVKLNGSYDVSYPIYDGRTAMGWDDVTYAYMKLDEIDAHMTTVTQQDIEWVRFKILRALLNKTNDTFLDPRWGNLTIRRLANQDGTLYPPQRIAGSVTESERQRYITTAYAPSAISDTNNPYATIRDELRKDFGRGMVCAWINSAQRAKTEALTDFVPRPLIAVQYGVDTDLAAPGAIDGIPGEFIGTINDVKIFIWDWIPANYIFAVDTNQPRPLKRRVDVPASLRGFKMVANEVEWPITTAYWRHREGYGVGNRLNGIAVFIDAGGTYNTPSDYA